MTTRTPLFACLLAITRLLAGWLATPVPRESADARLNSESGGSAATSENLGRVPARALSWRSFASLQRLGGASCPRLPSRFGGVGPVEMRLISGLPALQALLPSSSAASRDPLWPLDSAGSLRQWLSDQSVRWCEQDGSFAAHRAIALLELEAGAEYKALTERHRAARVAYKSAEGRLRVEEAEHAVQGGAHKGTLESNHPMLMVLTGFELDSIS